MKVYDELKELAKAGDDEILKSAYLILIEKDMDVADLAMFTAITSELESRGILRFDEEIFEYEFVI